jgi:type IV secretory pathway VirB3-like protein
MVNRKLQKYASYNVLARKALIYGVPIIPLVTLLIAILFTGFIGITSLGFTRGIIVPLILTGLLFFVRVISLDDSRAIESIIWDFKAAMTRLICRSSVTSFTSIDDSKEKRRALINEFYKCHNIK